MSNQHDQDRDRIAEAMGWRRETWAGHGMTYTWAKTTRVGDIDRRVVHPIVNTLDAAIAAFETLCEPKGWGLNMMSRGDGREKVWYVRAPEGANMLDDLSDALDDTWYAKSGNHAADVCRLVCMVLDREASNAK